MADLISIRMAPGAPPGARWDEIARRAKDLRPAHDAALATMRNGGAGSTFDQASSMATHTQFGGVLQWKRTQPFGRRPMPLRTLLRSGRYRAAITSKAAGTIEIREPHRVGFTLDGSVFPQWKVFQATAPTIIRAKTANRARNGRLMMQVVLGLFYGAWISERKLLEGLVVEPRRISTNPPMRRRVAEVFRAYLVASGSGQSRYSTPATPYRLGAGLRRRVA